MPPQRAGCTLRRRAGDGEQDAGGRRASSLFLVGAEDDALARIRPALEAMGKTIIHLGPVGSGALVKLINNFLCGVQAASLAEAIADDRAVVARSRPTRCRRS